MLTQSPNPSRRILVADDDPVVRHLVTRMIERESYEAVTVNDGSEALRLLQTDSNFIAAIFDMRMPRLEGLEVINFMQTEKRLRRIPVMMITSERDLQLMAKSFAAGVTLFLPKPFTPELFQTNFRLLLRGTNALSTSVQESTLTR
jgi:CheY-like chemotaxis protein